MFSSRDAATAFLSRLLSVDVTFRPYNPIFPELWIFERRGYRWLLCPAPVNPTGVSA